MMGSKKGALPTIEFGPDSILPKEELQIKSAVINQHGRLELVVNDQTLEYPVEWLRHNCQCQKCFNKYSLSFIHSIRKLFKLDITLKSVSVTKNGVTCIFGDGHEVEFNLEWLYHRRLTPDGIKVRNANVFFEHAVAWPKPEEVKVQSGTYKEVTETIDGYDAFASALIRDGLFVITGSPTDRCIHKEFGELTGLEPNNNHYGTNFIVMNEPTPINHAYTTIELDLHVDQPYLIRCPCIQLLHVRQQSTNGGENVMSDGVKAAMVLKERHPEYYQILTTTKIQSEDVVALSESQAGEWQSYLANRSPAIVVDEDGVPEYIQFNHAAHSSFFPGTAQEFEQYHKALEALVDITYECSITLKNNPGDIMVFDNQRVMHGRLGYDATQQRQLEGWYLDWDSVYSRLRVAKIRKSMGKTGLGSSQK